MMTWVFDEVFVPLTNKNVYSVPELAELRLQPAFIKTIVDQLQISYVESDVTQSNLCFAGHQDVQPAYRHAFSKRDVLKIVLPQISEATVQLNKQKVQIPDTIEAFFQTDAE